MEDDFLGHFYYEVMQLRICYFIIKAGNPGNQIVSTPNYLIVAFSTHARNLMEFFYRPIKGQKKRGDHYVKKLTSEKVKELFPKIDEYYEILCQNHSHLDYRIYNNKDISPVQITFPLYSGLKKILVIFLRGLPKKYRNEKMTDLLRCFEYE